jgi:hypothetical protein
MSDERPLTAQDKANTIERLKRTARRELDKEEAKERLDQIKPVKLIFDGEQEYKPTEWLIDKILPRVGFGWLVGELGTFKTWLALDWAAHIAEGKPWLDHPVKQGTVLFIETEGTEEFTWRYWATRSRVVDNDSTQLDLEKKFPIVCSYESLRFGPETDEEVVKAKAKFIRTAVEEHKLPPVVLVIMDTLIQNIEGDADNNHEAQDFIHKCQLFVRTLSDGPVFGMPLHHPGHKEKTRGRGAYAFEASMDLGLRLEGDKDNLLLTCTKSRDAERFAPIALQLTPFFVTRDGKHVMKGKDQRTALRIEAQKTSQSEQRDEIEDIVYECLPTISSGEWKSAYRLRPEVKDLLGRKVNEDTVRNRCETLKQKGLAECRKKSAGRPGLEWRRTQERESEI